MAEGASSGHALAGRVDRFRQRACGYVVVMACHRFPGPSRNPHVPLRSEGRAE